MEKRLTVLLVEDDKDICQEFKDYFEQQEDLTLLEVTNNSTKAVEYIKDYLPNAVILDLELHNGGGNGLFVLKELKNLNLDEKPYILITTNNSSAVTFDYARKLGADFIMTKHQEDYSVKSVIDFLVMMKSMILSNHVTMLDKQKEPPETKDKRLTRKISSELNCIGVNPKSVGYRYLIEAIKVIIDEPTPNVCNIIGEKFRKSEASVERAMQNAINRAWHMCDINDLLVHYTAKINSDKGVPTLTEFIYYYANKINTDY